MIDLNNTWCEATEDYYNELVNLGYIPKTDFRFATEHYVYLVTQKDTIIQYGVNRYLGDLKQIHLVDGEFQYVKEEDMVLEYKRYELPKEVKKDTEENSFNKHGFRTPEFEGEILKKLNNRILIGYVTNDKGNYVAQKWSITGASQEGKYNLIPIKKPWYEDESNFPCMIIYDEEELVHVRSYRETDEVLCSKIGGVYHELERCRPATKDEVLSLLIKE